MFGASSELASVMEFGFYPPDSRHNSDDVYWRGADVKKSLKQDTVYLRWQEERVHYRRHKVA